MVHYLLEKIMDIEIKDLVSNGSVLVDLTDAESSKVNGGYAAIVANDTLRADLAFKLPILF
jgi:hypothetical protein